MAGHLEVHRRVLPLLRGVVVGLGIFVELFAQPRFARKLFRDSHGVAPALQKKKGVGEEESRDEYEKGMSNAAQVEVHGVE